jgi:hypothetical protein
MSEKSSMFSGNHKEFYERQQAFLDKKLEKMETNKANHSEHAKCTFKPEINMTSEIMCEADPSRGKESE